MTNGQALNLVNGAIDVDIGSHVLGILMDMCASISDGMLGIHGTRLIRHSRTRSANEKGSALVVSPYTPEKSTKNSS